MLRTSVRLLLWFRFEGKVTSCSRSGKAQGQDLHRLRTDTQIAVDQPVAFRKHRAGADESPEGRPGAD